jgi:hypothetical protein
MTQSPLEASQYQVAIRPEIDPLRRTSQSFEVSPQTLTNTALDNYHVYSQLQQQENEYMA